MSMSQTQRDAAEFLGNSTIVAALSEGCIAPYLTGLSVPEVASFIKLRERYELEVVAYANLNSRKVEKVRTSWKHKVNLALMEEWADMKLSRAWSDVTEEEFKEALYEIRDRVVHSRTDVADVLKGKIKMDLKIEDVEQRVLTYFANIRQVITDNGLKDLINPDAERNSKYCSIVIKHLAPAPLKEDVEEHLTYDEFRICKKDRRKLYDLIVERGKKQQKRHNYLVKYGKDKPAGAGKRDRGDDKKPDGDGPNPKRLKKTKSGKTYGEKKSEDKNVEVNPKDKPSELAKLEVHMEGCLMCGGEHKLGEHKPKVSKAQSNYLWDALYKAKGIENPYKNKKKFLRKLLVEVIEDEDDEDETPKFFVKFNGVLEKPAIVDTGARGIPAISRKWLDELLVLDSTVMVEALKKPITFEAAGGHELVANEVVKVKIEVKTVSGTISSYKPITCGVIEQYEDLFLITNSMLKNIGINVDQQLLDKASQLSLPRELVCTVTNDGDDIASRRMADSGTYGNN